MSEQSNQLWWKQIPTWLPVILFIGSSVVGGVKLYLDNLALQENFAKQSEVVKSTKEKVQLLTYEVEQSKKESQDLVLRTVKAQEKSNEINGSIQAVLAQMRATLDAQEKRLDRIEDKVDKRG